VKVRIISGEFGGRMLDTPTRQSTHVMGDRVRTALFNMLGERVQGAEVLDAFAGSGSLGLEALSRGASFATFIEKDRTASKIVVKNTTELGVESKTKVINTTLANWLESRDKNSQNYDIIFVDPPYNNPQFSTSIKLVGLLKPNGIMILSKSGRMCVPTVEGVVVVDNRIYGEAELLFLQKRKEAPK